MTKNDDLELEQLKPQSHDSVGGDIRLILSLVLKNWYWFIIALVISLMFVRWYVGHTLPVYRTSATILINETDNRSLINNTDLLQGLGLPGGMKNLQNQFMIIKSRDLTESTLEDLSFEIDFYFKTFRNKLPLYPNLPLSILSEGELPLPKDTEFSLSFLGESSFMLQSESENHPFQKTASFGEEIILGNGSFTIELRNQEWLRSNLDRKLYFTVHSRAKLINYYSNRINVELVSREGSILRVSIQGTNRHKDVDFLNKHIEGFQAISLSRKNAEAERRIQFIDEQLIGISDSLSNTESRLQQFRSSHRVMDLSAQGQSIIGQVTLLENERARLNLEANYYDYLADYLSSQSPGEMPIVPITMGITDPGLTRLVDELAALQSQLSTTGAGEMNPLQRNLEQRIRSAKDALRETLNGLRRANSLARSENQEQINRANSQASALPVTERQLIGIERRFKLNDELYTFLLETRATQEMQKASNRADSEIIDYADPRFSAIVSPNYMRLNLLAFLAGLGVPFILIYFGYMFNKRIKEDDIRKITKLPIVGSVPRNSEKATKVVFEHANSSISEVFRLLRSRMQFFTKEAISPVILVTSSMPEDGKTFTAINLAAVYSLLGKKTVLVGFDLRKPRIFEDFELDNEKGVSTWLIGKDKIESIIKQTNYDNFFVISSGPIPPNPSELTALDKTAELFKYLREKFDYIIVDSSPAGLVSDTYHLASLSDACIMVVRPGHTLRDLFENTLNELMAGRVKGLSLVINDVKSDQKHYGYSGRYGYTKDDRKRKRFWFKQRVQ